MSYVFVSKLTWPEGVVRQDWRSNTRQYSRTAHLRADKRGAGNLTAYGGYIRMLGFPWQGSLDAGTHGEEVSMAL